MGISDLDPDAHERRPWNAGNAVGATRPLKPRDVWAIRFFPMSIDNCVIEPFKGDVFLKTWRCAIVPLDGRTLFVSQSVDRIGARDAYRVTRDRDDRDAEREQPGHDERRRLERDAIVKPVEPVAHHPPGNRPGNDIGDHDRLAELPDKQAYDVAGSRAEHLADADFLGPALRGESRQPEQSQAADDHGEQRESGKDFRASIFGLVEIAHDVVTELGFERHILRDRFPDRFDPRADGGGIALVADDQFVMALRRVLEEQGVDRRADRAEP